MPQWLNVDYMSIDTMKGIYFVPPRYTTALIISMCNGTLSVK